MTSSEQRQQTGIGHFDVAVVGTGMAGTAAALAAAEAGARVLALDSAPAIGGSARLSRALFWSLAPGSDYRSLDPEAQVERLEWIAGALEGDLEWLGRYGLELGPRLTGLYGIGAGRKGTRPMPELFDDLHNELESRGVMVRTGVTVDELEQTSPADSSNETWRISAYDMAGGVRVTGYATAVVLASGGYPADQARWRGLLPDGARWAIARSNPHSNGTALRIAEHLGLAVRGDFERFYGHLMPLGVELQPDEFAGITLNISEYALLVDEQGRRFADESRGDWFNAEEVALNAHGRALLILDSATLELATTTPRFPGAPAFDPLPRLRELGANIVNAPSARELFRQLRELLWLPELRDVEFAAVLDEFELVLARFNDQAERLGRPGLRKPPFSGMIVSPGITFGKGGLAVDDRSRVLLESGEPRAGLFAAGSDVGGLYREAYAGGLGPALVLGRAAGRNAAEHANRGVIAK